MPVCRFVFNAVAREKYELSLFEKEERIGDLGFVLLLALLLWCLVEVDLDRNIAGAGCTLGNCDKKQTRHPTASKRIRHPTAFMMRFKFAHSRVVRLGDSIRLLEPLSEV